jgi:hypothetical protein
MKHPRQLARSRSNQRRCFSRGVEHHQNMSYEIESPLRVAVPETPTDPRDCLSKANAHLTVACRGVRPTLDGLGNMLARSNGTPFRKVTHDNVRCHA